MVIQYTLCHQQTVYAIKTGFLHNIKSLIYNRPILQLNI